VSIASAGEDGTLYRWDLAHNTLAINNATLYAIGR
jgi:hypothetical protein